MKKITSIIIILFLSFLSPPSWSETLTIDDLVQRDGLIFKKFTDIPFTGKITGREQGSIKDGKFDGEWVTYYNNGQLFEKGEYKDGKEEGEWVIYSRNGLLITKGEYKDGKRIGEWVDYWTNGNLHTKGEYKDGKRIGEWVYYHQDGSFNSKKIH